MEITNERASEPMATTAMMCTAVAAAASATMIKARARSVGAPAPARRRARRRARARSTATTPRRSSIRADDASVVAFGRRARADGRRRAARGVRGVPRLRGGRGARGDRARCPPAAPAPAPKAKAVPLTPLEQPVMAYEFAYPTETRPTAPPMNWAPLGSATRTPPRSP